MHLGWLEIIRNLSKSKNVNVYHVKHRQHVTIALQRHVQHEQKETKALAPNDKHELNETKAFKPNVKHAQHAPHALNLLKVHLF